MHFGVTQAISEKFETYIWDPKLGHENIIHAERSQIGIVFAGSGINRIWRDCAVFFSGKRAFCQPVT